MRLRLDKESSAGLEADISLFEEMFSAKVRFFDDMVENREPGSAVAVADLRQETIYEIAQFFYFLKVFGIDSPENLRVFALSHNKNIEDLLENGEDRDKLGVQKTRLQDALFDTDEKLERLEVNCGAGPIKMSQSDLARFLVEHMSSETCRAGVKVLGDAGYLRLSKSPFGAILIRSSGALEEVFAGYIRSFRRVLSEKFPPEDRPRRSSKLKEVST